MLHKIFNRLVRYILGGASTRVKLKVELFCFTKRKKWVRLTNMVSKSLQNSHGVFISPNAKIVPSLSLRHPVGIVIGDGVKIGENVIIYQNVTVGGARIGDGRNRNYPEIGDHTVIFSGAAIIGAVSVGRNCIIGANAVVNKSVPDNCVVAGVPARIIKRNSGL